MCQKVGIGTKTPNASAVLDLTSDTLGLLIPRMTAAQRDAIHLPATGLLVFVSTDSSFYYREAGSWRKIAGDGESWKLTGNENATGKFVGTKDTSALRFRTRNLERMVVDSNGRIGINMKSPESFLHMVDDGNLLADIILQYSNSPNIFPALALRKSGGSAAAKLATDSNSYVGGVEFLGYDGANWPTIGYVRAITESNFASGQYKGSLHFGTNTGDNLVIKNGNVGINVSDPHALLQFPRSIATRKIVLYEDFNNDNQFWGFGINANVLRYQLGNTAADHVFYAGATAANSNELMRIKGNGNVGIGLANPTNTLQVAGSLMVASTLGSFRVHPFFPGGTTTLLATFEGAGSNGPQMRFKTSTADFTDIGLNGTGGFVVERNDNPLLTVTTAGNVGIGTASPNNKLEVNGVIDVRGFRGHAGVNDAVGTNVINWKWTGTQLQGWVDATNVGILSDRRLKSNIKEQKEPAISRLMALKPVSFNYKKIERTVFTGSEVLQEGFIADELQQVIPSAVNGEKDAVTADGAIQPQTINLMPLISVLTKAMQEQQKQIEKLQAQVEKQQSQIEQLLKK